MADPPASMLYLKEAQTGSSKGISMRRLGGDVEGSTPWKSNSKSKGEAHTKVQLMKGTESH